MCKAYAIMLNKLGGSPEIYTTSLIKDDGTNHQTVLIHLDSKDMQIEGNWDFVCCCYRYLYVPSGQNWIFLAVYAYIKKDLIIYKSINLKYFYSKQLYIYYVCMSR